MLHTVKSAHIRSIFSGFLGPPFLFNLTKNLSLKGKKKTRNTLHLTDNLKYVLPMLHTSQNFQTFMELTQQI